MPTKTAKGYYTIADVSRLTGVSCNALRHWERRYGFPCPSRSPAGHRRFDAGQVDALRDLSGQIGRGRPIDLLLGEARALSPTPPAPAGPAPAEPHAPLVDRLLGGDLPAAEATYRSLIVGLDPAEVVGRVVAPALTEVGDRWFRGQCAVHQERVATSFLRGKVASLWDLARSANERPRGTVLLAALQGERHEGGLLICGLMLELAGCRAVMLGVDLPVAELQGALDAWRPGAVGVSFVLSRNINKRFAELGRLRGAPVFVGGRSILNHQRLARRHGLTPLPGRAAEAVEVLVKTCIDVTAG